MKKAKIHIVGPARLLIIVLGTALLFSCRKEMSVETPTGLSGDFTAQINGVQWIAADTARSASILAGLINITGVSADNKQLSITLTDTVTGTYTLDQLSSSLAAYADNDSSDIYAFSTNQGIDTSQAGGIVIVNEIDRVKKTLSGTFSFKVFRFIDGRQKVITSGVFYKLPYVNSLPVAKGSDTLLGDIDGAGWIAQSISAQSISGQLVITGSLVNGSKTIGLIMPASITRGSYPMDFNGFTYIGLYDPTPAVELASPSGSLTILANDVRTKRIQGNFEFQATDPQGGPSAPHSITDGFFSVYYGP
jgi:hypothetical protein